MKSPYSFAFQSLRAALVLLLQLSLAGTFAMAAKPAPIAPMTDATGPAPVVTPKSVKVKKASRDFKPFRPKLNFSDSPTDLEIRAARLFEEPLIPMEGAVNLQENAALARALVRFKGRENPEDLSALTAFLEKYPASRWRASLELNLGLIQYQTGFFTAALNSWKIAWDLSSGESELSRKAVADRAISEFLLLNAKIGRVDTLSGTLEELGDRPIEGSAEEKVTSAKEGLQRMKNRPEIAFKCGPFAVNSILYQDKKTMGRDKVVEGAKSSVKGTSLAQLKGWADSVGLQYQAAKRISDGEFPLPMVIHWKLGHFAAVLKEKDGRYLVKDPTFGGGELWISAKALKAESSGYCLIPKGPMPEGWQSVSISEAGSVWGKGGAPNRKNNDNGEDAPQTGGCPPYAMARASMFTALATLHIADIPVAYQAPFGPHMDFKASYSHLETNQPANFTFSNFGPAWNFNWLSYLTVDPSQNVSIAVRGGGTEIYPFSQKDNVTNVFSPNLLSQASLAILAKDSYERRLPDGSTEVYDQLDGTGRIFLSKVIDPQGNSALIHYNANFRIDYIVDAIGQQTTITYKSDTFGNAGYYKIYRVTDPFGRFAQFDYDATVSQLIRITDEVGMQSEFAYDLSGSFIHTLTTPYGKTIFSSYVPQGGLGARGLKFTYADGTSQVIENWIDHELSSYFWDRKAWILYPGDKTKAFQTHWLIDPSANVQSSVAQFSKKALESKVAYLYEGASEAEVDGPGTTPHSYVGVSNIPTQTMQLLDGDDYQIYINETNRFGRSTKTVDPEGRTFVMSYAANGIDLLEVRQKKGANNDLLGKWVYNDQHLPLNHTDASGRKTVYTYNSAGQLLTVTNPENEITTLTYYSSDLMSGPTLLKQRKSRLQSIDGPLSGTSDSTTLDYDPFGRVKSVTSSEGYAVSYDYDNLNRLTKVTYPDGSYEQTTWDKLNPIFSRDRLGRWTQRSYDSLAQMVSETDPLGRTTGYVWCKCGSIATLTDPKGQVTTWDRDVQGRVTRKLFADGKDIDYVYEDRTSRLKNETDATGQTRNYVYNLDNSLKQMSYANATIATSTVDYTYDPNYLRLLTVSNGWGATSYTYNATVNNPYASPISGGGKLQKVTNSAIANSDITFLYDELGRVTNRSIDGANNSVTWTYDAAGRVSGETGPLGTFTYAYLNAASGGSRISSVTYPNGQVVNYGYQDNNHDQRLQQIENLNAASAQISKFGYDYNTVGQITRWTQQAEGGTAMRYDLGYDKADQLISGVLKNDATNVVAKQVFYGYDPAGNRSSEQINGGVQKAVFNNVNQETSQSGGGPVRFEGVLDTPGTVTVNGLPAQMTDPTHFVSNPVLSAGSNSVTVAATDGSSNTQTNTYQVTVDAGTNRTLTYDDNGNLVNNGNGQTYNWDAQNRLVKIIYGGNGSSEFTYDGLDRRVKIVEKDGSGTVTSDRRFLWEGMEICEERSSSSARVKRYYGSGMVLGTAASPAATDKFYYTRDHLGSVRELTTSTGATQSAYDYDLYGRQESALPTGMKIWLKADAGVTKDGSNKVSAWVDQSGNGNNAAQATSAAQPTWVANAINGQAVMRFGGTDDALLGTMNFNPGSSDHSMFVVHNRTTEAYGSAPFSFAVSLSPQDTGAPMMTWIDTTNQFGTSNSFIGWSFAKSVDLSSESGEYHSSNISRRGGINGDGAALAIRSIADSTLYETRAVQNWTSTTSGQYIVGCHIPHPSFPGHWLIGDVAEVIVYDRALSPAERTRVESYLARKYGRREVQSDFRYTGHFYHERSGLSLAPYRAYEADLVRWLSRDPIAEEGGINLYAYVSNNPINWIDSLGLQISGVGSDGTVYIHNPHGGPPIPIQNNRLAPIPATGAEALKDVALPYLAAGPAIGAGILAAPAVPPLAVAGLEAATPVVCAGYQRGLGWVLANAAYQLNNYNTTPPGARPSVIELAKAIFRSIF